jgi:hypothetical protein
MKIYNADTQLSMYEVLVKAGALGFQAQKDKGPRMALRGPEIRHKINSFLFAETYVRVRLRLYAQTIKLSGHREGTMGCSHLSSRLRPYGYEHFTMSIPAAIEGCQFFAPTSSFV